MVSIVQFSRPKASTKEDALSALPPFVPAQFRKHALFPAATAGSAVSESPLFSQELMELLSLSKRLRSLHAAEPVADMESEDEDEHEIAKLEKALGSKLNGCKMKRFQKRLASKSKLLTPAAKKPKTVAIAEIPAKTVAISEIVAKIPMTVAIAEIAGLFPKLFF